MKQAISGGKSSGRSVPRRPAKSETGKKQTFVRVKMEPKPKKVK